jgi:hypothetical protein
MFLDPDQPISKHGNKLPHWQQGQALIFVTWRLADSIPHHLLANWKAMRDTWMELHPSPWTEAVEDEYHQRFSQQVEDWLDTGIGSCVLKNRPLNGLVADAFQHFEGKRYQLESFVVMPNHVHVIFQPNDGFEMESISKAGRGLPLVR